MLKHTGHGTLYDQQDRTVMKNADDSLDPKSDRVNELILFAKQSGYKKIGIGNCINFNKEASQLEETLVAEGFEVVKTHCKMGKMPYDEIMPGYKGVSCNPAGQAKLLEEQQTDLNIQMGLCVGHDMIFNKKSHAPTSTLVVKDRKLNHYTLQKLKT